MGEWGWLFWEGPSDGTGQQPQKGRSLFPCESGPALGTGCPGRLWHLQPWRYQNAAGHGPEQPPWLPLPGQGWSRCSSAFDFRQPAPEVLGWSKIRKLPRRLQYYWYQYSNTEFTKSRYPGKQEASPPLSSYTCVRKSNWSLSDWCRMCAKCGFTNEFSLRKMDTTTAFPVLRPNPSTIPE